jgi:hypothetical protein
VTKAHSPLAEPSSQFVFPLPLCALCLPRLRGVPPLLFLCVKPIPRKPRLNFSLLERPQLASDQAVRTDTVPLFTYVHLHKYIISKDFKPIRMNTYRFCRHKSFRSHTYRKTGGAPLRSQAAGYLTIVNAARTHLCTAGHTLLHIVEHNQTMASANYFPSFTITFPCSYMNRPTMRKLLPLLEPHLAWKADPLSRSSERPFGISIAPFGSVPKVGTLCPRPAL